MDVETLDWHPAALEAAGITHIMALRGDLPRDWSGALPGDFPHAADLVRFADALEAGVRGQVRYNLDGTLYVPYGYVAALQSDPTEKKPFFHIHPGSDTLTFGMSFEKYHSDNVFFPGSQSVYVYNSLQDFYTDALDYLANPNRTTSTFETMINRYLPRRPRMTSSTGGLIEKTST